MNQLELGARIATDLIDEIAEDDPERIVFDGIDKFRQGRCVIISGPSKWIKAAKGNYALIYICLDAGAWGTMSLYEKEEAAIKAAKRIIKKLEIRP